MLGKLYSNNFMVILNRRIRIFGDDTDPTGDFTSITYGNATRLSGQTSVQVTEGIPIKIHREVWSKADSEDPNSIKLEDMTPRVSSSFRFSVSTRFALAGLNLFRFLQIGSSHPPFTQSTHSAV